MLDLQKHKDFLWKYTLSYGKLEQRDGISVFPFCNILMEEGKTIEDYKSDAIKEKLYNAQNVSEIFDLISKEYKGYYFMEISTPVSEDKELYSSLLKKAFDTCGYHGYISQKNYEHLVEFASEDVKDYILKHLA